MVKTPYLMAVAIKVKPQLRTTCLTQLPSYTAAIGILVRGYPLLNRRTHSFRLEGALGTKWENPRAVMRDGLDLIQSSSL